jgi:two-component system chemotaxis response regulator CheY
MKLLIVDDANVIRRQIKRSIEETGVEQAATDFSDYEIQTAANGLEAMHKFETFDPDIVTMDITMPEMDGLSCVLQMIKKKPTTKILVISALADRPTAVEAVRLGARGFLLKPFSSESLNEELTELLKEPRRARK